MQKIGCSFYFHVDVLNSGENPCSSKSATRACAQTDGQAVGGCDGAAKPVPVVDCAFAVVVEPRADRTDRARRRNGAQ